MTAIKLNPVEELLNNIKIFATLDSKEQLKILSNSSNKFEIGEVVWSLCDGVLVCQLIIEDIELESYEAINTVVYVCSFKFKGGPLKMKLPEQNLFRTRNEVINAQISYLERLRDKEDPVKENPIKWTTEGDITYIIEEKYLKKDDK